MGGGLGKILTIAVAIFAPYAAAALGLTGFGATAFGFLAQGLVGKLVGGSSMFGGGNKSGSGAGTNDTGLLVNKQSTVNPIYTVYGERKLGGQRIYINTSNSGGDVDGGNEYLHLGFSLCQGEIGWINAFTFQDKVAWIHPDIIADDANPYYAARNAESSISLSDWRALYDAQGRSTEFSSLFNVALYRGAQNTYTDTWYNTESDTSWFTSEFKTGGLTGSEFTGGKGLAWVYMRLRYDRDKFPGAPAIQFDLTGKRVVDFIDDGTDADFFDDNTTVRNDTYANLKSDLLAYKNPANALYDYMTSTVYGKGLSNAVLSGFDFAALRTYCYNKGLEVNGALNPDDTIFNNTQTILNAANAFFVYTQGKYAPKPIASLIFNSNTYTFDEDNILGEWNIALGSKKNKQNRAKINFFNPAQNWQRDIVTFPSDDSANTFLTEDGGIINEKQIDLPLTSSVREATALGSFLVKLSRNQDIVTFKTTWKSLQNDIGDPVYVKHAVPGWNSLNSGAGKKFRIVGMTLRQDATVNVTLIEYPDDDIWIPNYTYS